MTLLQLTFKHVESICILLNACKWNTHSLYYRLLRKILKKESAREDPDFYRVCYFSFFQLMDTVCKDVAYLISFTPEISLSVKQQRLRL